MILVVFVELGGQRTSSALPVGISTPPHGGGELVVLNTSHLADVIVGVSPTLFHSTCWWIFGLKKKIHFKRWNNNQIVCCFLSGLLCRHCNLLGFSRKIQIAIFFKEGIITIVSWLCCFPFFYGRRSRSIRMCVPPPPPSFIIATLSAFIMKKAFFFYPFPLAKKNFIQLDADAHPTFVSCFFFFFIPPSRSMAEKKEKDFSSGRRWGGGGVLNKSIGNFVEMFFVFFNLKLF